MNSSLSGQPEDLLLPPFGINRNRLDVILLKTGGAIWDLRGTGEIAYSHPALPERPRANGRRKDAPAHLVRFVRRVMLIGRDHATTAGFGGR